MCVVHLLVRCTTDFDTFIHCWNRSNERTERRIYRMRRKIRISQRKCLDKKLLKEYFEEVLSPPEAQPTKMWTAFFHLMLLVALFFHFSFWFSVSKTFRFFVQRIYIVQFGTMRCSPSQFLEFSFPRTTHSCGNTLAQRLVDADCLVFLYPFHHCQLLWCRSRKIENYSHLCCVKIS